MSLSRNHIDDLNKSGLTKETIERAQLYTETDPQKISELLNWKQPAVRLGPCLVFPFLDLAGNPTGYHRLKPDTPRPGKNGKLVKYEAPRGESPRAYFPPGLAASLEDPTSLIVFTEGEKKSLKATQDGFSTIGLSGIWGWQQKRNRDEEGRGQGDRNLLPELANVDWSSREVFIVFDADEKREVQQKVRFARDELGKTLQVIAQRQSKSQASSPSTIITPQEQAS